MRSIWVATALAAVCAGCGGAPDADTDGGRLDGGAGDSGTTTEVDAAPGDAGDGIARDEDGCIIGTLGAFSVENEDDVSITYQAEITPRVNGRRYLLHLLFNRYDVAYTGEFDLTEGMDANYGSCARCVLGYDITMVDHGFFADRGTLTLGKVPFTRVLDAGLENVRLVETNIVAMDGVPTSVPVEDGACIAIVDTTVSETFPPDGWHCETSQYRDDTTCDCGCGAFDPDCRDYCELADPTCDPFDPPAPLPPTGCEDDELCGHDGQCIPACDHAARTGCDEGVCGFGFEGDQCYPRTGSRIDDAALGENCAVGNLFCAVTDGFLDGMCDDLDGYLCRPLCDDPSDCQAGELCWTIFEGSKGFCRPPPPDDG